MKHIQKHPLAVLIGAVMLTACSSGGGGFDLPSTGSTTLPSATNTNGAATTGSGGTGSQSTAQNTPPATPNYQDESSQRRTIDTSTSQAALGYVVDIPRRHNNAEIANIQTPKATNYALDNLPYADEIKSRPRASEDGLVHSHDGGSLSRTRPFDYVRSGYFIDTEAGVLFVKNEETGKRDMYQGASGVVYYQGTKPSTTLPTQSVKYQGVWDFVSNADKARTNVPSGFTRDNQSLPANASGATPLDAYVNHKIDGKKLAHSSEFDVDFGAKTLTGKLYTNGYVASQDGEQKISQNYTLDAKIHGNRFKGTATATQNNHDIFGKNGELEGGFFGEKAEELAGKFLAEDNSLFATFAAKRDKISDDDLQKSFDAISIAADTGGLQKSNLDTFGNVAYLVLDGKPLSLLPADKTKFADMAFYDTVVHQHDGKTISIGVCCNNLDYVKFGNHAIANQDGGTTVLSDGHLFLLGERTDANQIPNTGTAHYRGTWEGYIESKDGRRWSEGAGNGEADNRSRFDMDFGNKSFTGKLIAKNGTEDLPLLTLSGKIIGNGFTGTAKTRENGFTLDAGSTGNAAVAHLNADVIGGFYGSDGLEIGGVIHANQADADKVGIVFGGKRQTKK